MKSDTEIDPVAASLRAIAIELQPHGELLCEIRDELARTRCWLRVLGTPRRSATGSRSSPHENSGRLRVTATALSLLTRRLQLARSMRTGVIGDA